MVTALLMVFAVLLAVGMIGMVVLAFRGEFFATVYVCFGGLASAGELLASVVVAIVAGLTGHD